MTFTTEVILTMLMNNLLPEAMESSDNTAVIIEHLYVITDTVCSPESNDAGAVKQTAVHDVGQHSLSIIKQLPCFFACSTIITTKNSFHITTFCFCQISRAVQDLQDIINSPTATNNPHQISPTSTDI